MLGAIYKLWPASGFPLAGLVLVVPGNLVMPSVDSARGGGGAGGGGSPGWTPPGGSARGGSACGGAGRSGGSARVERRQAATLP